MFKETYFYLNQLNEEKAYLVEGIILFKSSEKINKLIKNIEERTEGEDVGEIVNKLEGIRDSFKDMEKKYKTNKEANLKNEYRKLELKYKSLLSSLDGEKVIKALKGLGVISFVAAAVTLGYYGVVSNSQIATDALTTGSMASKGDIFSKGISGSKEVVTGLLNGRTPSDLTKTLDGAAEGTKNLIDNPTFIDKILPMRAKVLQATYDRTKQASVLLKTAGVMNAALYGSVAGGVAGFISLLKKINDKINFKNNDLYYKTKNTLEKFR